MIPYIFHVSILLAVCYAFYWLLLRQETFFQLNRSVLLACLIIPLFLPLISIPASWSLGFFKNGNTTINRSTTYISSNDLMEKSTSEKVISEEKSMAETATRTSRALPEIKEQQVPVIQSKMSIDEVLTYLYFSGVIIFSLAFFIQLMLILAKVTSLQSLKDGKYRIVELVKDEAPYSFWTLIFINPTKYEPETYEQILAHEKIHIDQTHFVDKLLVEIILIAFWFNPFVWLFRKAITNNLEFLTDQSMLTQGFPKQTYQLSLLKVSVPQHPLNLTINYNQSFLKNRIAMMNMKKSSARSVWKYLFIIPLLTFSVMSLNAVKATPNDPTPVSENRVNDISTESDIAPLEKNDAVTTSEISERVTDAYLNNNTLTSIEERWKDQLKKELISNLTSDDLWKKGNHIFKLFPDKIIYDGIQMNRKLTKKYKAIFDKYGISPNSNRFLMLTPIVVMSGKFVSDDANFDGESHIDVFNEEQDLSTSGEITNRSYSSSNSQSDPRGYGYGESIARGYAEANANKHAQGNAHISNHNNSQSSAGGTHVETINGKTYIRGAAGSVHHINGRTIKIPSDSQNQTYLLEENGSISEVTSGGIFSRETSKRGRVLFDDGPKWTNNPSTFIGKMRSTNHWRLPEFYKKVKEELIKDEIVEEGEKIKISFESRYVDVNGWHLTGGQDQKYYQLAKQYNITVMEGWSMEIKNDHVVINSRIRDLQQFRLDVLNALQNDHLIPDKKEEVQLEITGTRIILNGTDVPQNRFNFYRNLIHEYQITPGPGKEIVINERRKGSLFKKRSVTSIRVGYNYDGSYLGSIMMTD
jgi:beta-lactamase regulating signal transducer with metallopeptidase domain